MVLARYFALTILVVFFAQDVIAVTDEQFEELRSIVEDLKNENKDLKNENEIQGSMIMYLTNKVDFLSKVLSKPKSSVSPNTIQKLDDSMTGEPESMQNVTIEERVALLEIQVADVEVNISILFENDNFLFDETVIQDERLFSLEQETEEIEDDIVNLQANTLDLEVRVGNLEENSGDDGNSSITELELWVETLEDITADQETRIVAAEKNIQGLQQTDINHDARISALEENGGGDTNQNSTIAFYAVMAESPTITFDTTVIFADVVINSGSGYDETTGVFTVPPGGDGLYYFSVYILVQGGENAEFNIVVNNLIVSSIFGDGVYGPDQSQVSCSAVVDVVEGDEIEVIYDGGSDTTPIGHSSVNVFNGFNGFKI